jgi:hypothetical protein
MKNLFGEEIVEEREYELPPKKSRNVFDYVKSINTKSEYLGNELEDYSPYIVSKALAGSLDCIMIVNEINLYPSLSTKMEYDYYYHSVRKSRRFAEWLKKDHNVLDDLVEYFQISRKKAQEILSLLSEDDLKEIHDYLTIGITEK